MCIRDRVEEAMPVYGCNTLMTESDREMFHTPIAVWNLSATFSDKMWFWPISHGELKRNKLSLIHILLIIHFNISHKRRWTFMSGYTH